MRRKNNAILLEYAHSAGSHIREEDVMRTIGIEQKFMFQSQRKKENPEISFGCDSDMHGKAVTQHASHSVFLGGSFRNSGHSKAWRTACTCNCPNNYRQSKIYAVDKVLEELLRSSNSEFWREEKQYPGVVRLGRWNSMHLTYGFIDESAQIFFVQKSGANVHCRFFSACSR